jgi:SAM-dependent methyltransferase
MNRPTERFSSRVHDYARYRPGYPDAVLELLGRRCGLGPGAVVGDIGSGTGILTELLLRSGAEVIAVEPNDGMRSAAEARLGAQPRFRSVAARAEATGLAGASLDLWVAAQAFHWFEPGPTRAEALRVLRPAGAAALLWNEQPPASDGLVADYDALLRRHATDYLKIKSSRADEGSMRRFFGAAFECAEFPNEQRLDFEGLRGRLMSSSYAPEAGHPQHEPMLVGLCALFERYAQDGVVLFPYRTLVYFGPLRRDA